MFYAWGHEKCIQGFGGLEQPEGRSVIEGRIILKGILNKYYETV
jgi:hypothetical protein